MTNQGKVKAVVHWECCIGKWRAKIVILLRIAIQQVSLFEKLLAVCYGGCFIAQR